MAGAESHPEVAGDDEDEWRRRGVTDPLVISRLRRLGAKPTDLREFSVQVVPTEMAVKWLSADLDSRSRLWAQRFEWAGFKFTPQEAKRWISAGVSSATAAAEWRRAGFTFREVIEFGKLGATTVESAQVARAREGGPLGVVGSDRAGVSVPDLTADLLDAGLDPEQVERIRALRIDPYEALQAVEVGLDFDEIVDWRTAGVKVGDLLPWRRLGFSIRQVEDWRRVGVLDPEMASEWIAAGIADPGAVAGWRRVGFGSPAKAQRWASVGFTWEEAAEWRQVGASSPEVAASERLRGASPALLKEWSKRTGRSWRRMSEFLAAALTPEEAIRYALADAGSTDPRPLVPYRLLDGSVIGRLAMEGMAAEELLELRRAGLTTAEIERVAEVLTAPALAQMRTRKVPYPEWLGQLDTSARQSPPRPDRAAAGHGVAARTAAEDHWLERAHPWLTAAGFNLRHPPELLSYLRENGLDFATSTSELFDLEVDDEWLEDIQQRALHVSAHLNREPQWPVSFVSTTTTVVLDARSSRAVAWVGRGSLGGLVTFDIATFEVSMLQSPNSAYMAGLAISWFVDCCILLRSPAAAARVLQLDNDPMPKGSQPGFRYAPKPSFECDFLDVATGVRATPSPHRVAGHPRTLRPDQRPSQAALERVPPRLRGTLASNQTWVQEHDRAGAADGDNLYSHLSKYSCLADSLGTAQRHR